MKTREIVIASILFMFIAFALGYFVGKKMLFNQGAVIINRADTTLRVDTLIQPGEVIKIKGKGVITYTTKYDTIVLKDTVFYSRAFVSVLDTIHKKDTIHVAYFFPLDIHYITIKKGQDSIFTKTLTILQPVEIKDPWWKQPAIILGSVTAGFLIGKALK